MTTTSLAMIYRLQNKLLIKLKRRIVLQYNPSFHFLFHLQSFLIYLYFFRPILIFIGPFSPKYLFLFYTPLTPYTFTAPYLTLPAFLTCLTAVRAECLSIRNPCLNTSFPTTTNEPHPTILSHISNDNGSALKKPPTY